MFVCFFSSSVTLNACCSSSSYRLRRTSKSGERRAEGFSGAIAHVQERGPLPLSRGVPAGFQGGLVHPGRDVEHPTHLSRCVPVVSRRAETFVRSHDFHLYTQKAIYIPATKALPHADDYKRALCLCRRRDVPPSIRARGLLERSPGGDLRPQRQHHHRVQTGLRQDRPECRHLREWRPLVPRPPAVRPHRWAADTAAWRSLRLTPFVTLDPCYYSTFRPLEELIHTLM